MKKMMLFVALLLGLTARGWAGGLEDLQSKWYDSENNSELVVSTDSLMINLTYVGSSTEAVVTIGSGVVSGYAPALILDTNLNFDISAAAYDTIGELCDKIENLADYKCSMLGAKRDDSSRLLRDQTNASGTNDLKAAGGFDVKADTGSDSGTFQGAQANLLRIGITPKTGKRVILSACTANVNVAGDFRVFGKRRKYEGISTPTRNDTTRVWTAATTDDTDLTTTWSVAGGIEGTEFAIDEHVVIDGSSTGSQGLPANFLRCSWKER